VSESLFVDGAVFAKCVGSYTSGDLLLFKVSREIAERGDDWSEPVQYRFTQQQGAFIELEMRRVIPEQVSEEAKT
jgi:hypothetical protein